MPNPNSPEILIPRRVKEERLQRGWTLQELAERSAVSRAMISKIERGESSPSAVLLSRLAGAMGVSLSSLMSRSCDSGPALRRMRDQPVWVDPATGYVRRLVSAAGGEGDLEIVAVELPPGQTATFAPIFEGRYDEQVLLLEGRLELRSADVTFVLEPGDCARVEASKEHAFHNPRKSSARYLVVKRREASPGNGSA